MPEPPFEGSSIHGRVYVLQGFASASLERCGRPGSGAVEIRILSPAGCGRGLFVGEGEFLFPPGSTFKIVGRGKDVLFVEQVRRLLTPSEMAGMSRGKYLRTIPVPVGRDYNSIDRLNRLMIANAEVPEGFLPSFRPAPTESAGWRADTRPSVHGIYG
ncbi:hypothetical protein TALC_00155 [Thermoplasmatales archaeon BRNA1]|nr:hypothetical protein TALC_00155 [Thermoplasmatales archaeon BRNA1]